MTGLILSGELPCPEGWVTVKRRRDGKLLHTPAWAWKRIEATTDVADRVQADPQRELFSHR